MSPGVAGSHEPVAAFLERELLGVEIKVYSLAGRPERGVNLWVTNILTALPVMGKTRAWSKAT